MTFHFANPFWLFLLGLIIPMLWHYNRSQKAVRVASLGRWKVSRHWGWSIYPHLIIGSRILAFVALTFAMARPQLGRSHGTRKTEGLDIMLVVDTSGSMKALDFTVGSRRVDRLQVVKNVLSEFIAGRSDDRMGLVVFGSHAFAQTPLTLDHDVLWRYVEGAQIGMAGEATAIGDAVGVAINRLKDLKSKSKIIILLTDGSNTAGRIDPKQAAEAAKALGVKIYAIGIGSKGPVPIQTELGLRQVVLDIDEDALKDLAKTTGGRYFAASNTESLRDVYRVIDRLETTTVEVKVYHTYEEQFGWLVVAALILLLLELVLRTTRLRRVP